MPVSGDGVENVMKELAGKLPADTDEVPDLIVEKCVEFMKKRLTDMCNALMESDIFPDRLKPAIIKHVLKKGGGDAEYIQNYRLISRVRLLKNSRKCNVQ